MKTTNPFQNIKNSKAASIALQEVSENTVIKKKRGRPTRPNLGKYLVKLDKALHRQVEGMAASLGTSNSFIIAEALRMYFKTTKPN